MKAQYVLVILLFIEAALVLTGLILGQNVWLGIICYWAILTMKNFLDFLDWRNDHEKK